MSTRPTVSCLMVTADRPRLCRRAIHCYWRQTYPSKELVVLDNGEESVDHLLDDLPAEEVRYRYVERTPDLWIGGLRNQALEMAGGELIAAQWDDDDWSHPDRLRVQVDALEGGYDGSTYDACTLAGTLMHVDTPEHFDHPFIGLLPDGVPPTILHRRDARARFPNIRRTEDTTYLEYWRARRYLKLPRAWSHLYLRYFHGGNLWEENHFVRRARNTPRDLLLYVWHKYVRGDAFAHPRYQLSEDEEEAFQTYLDDSRAVELFTDRKGRRTASA